VYQVYVVPVPKCLADTSALVPKCLWFLRWCQSVRHFGTSAEMSRVRSVRTPLPTAPSINIAFTHTRFISQLLLVECCRILKEID